MAKRERREHPTRQILIATVQTLLETKPADELTLDDVLEASGISVGSLYHHFEDFPHLIEEGLVAQYAAEVDASIKGLAKSVDGATNATELLAGMRETTVRTNSASFRSNREQRVRVMAKATTSERFRAALSTHQQRLVDGYADIVQDAQRKGLVKPDINPHVLATFALAYGLGYVLNDVTERPVADEDWADFILRVMESAVIVSSDAEAISASDPVLRASLQNASESASSSL